MSPKLFARAISKGEPIKVFNNGDMIRDFTYIDDIPVLTLCDKMGMYIWDMGQILIQNFGPIVNRAASSKLRFLVVFKEKRKKNILKWNNCIEI